MGIKSNVTVETKRSSFLRGGEKRGSTHARHKHPYVFVLASLQLEPSCQLFRLVSSFFFSYLFHPPPPRKYMSFYSPLPHKLLLCDFTSLLNFSTISGFKNTFPIKFAIQIFFFLLAVLHHAHLFFCCERFYFFKSTFAHFALSFSFFSSLYAWPQWLYMGHMGGGTPPSVPESVFCETQTDCRCHRCSVDSLLSAERAVWKL